MTTVESKLDELQAKWERLKRDVKEQGKDASAAFEKDKSTFEPELAEAKARLRDTADLTSEAWTGAEDAVHTVYENLKKRYDEIQARYE
ncbi:MAG: hypothetical protein IH624_17605 [Phycisphaerae bacterium]|nr:hypothetical protein [Phycisphaerae bacterium]